MRTILFACLAVGAASVALSSPARAEYWRDHREVEWQKRAEFKEAEHHKVEWLREHCIRTWSGQELCRR